MCRLLYVCELLDHSYVVSTEQLWEAVSTCDRVHVLTDLIQNAHLKARGDTFRILFVVLWD